MKNRQKMTLIIWLKRIIGFIAITTWMYIIYTISKSPAPFMEQAPYCMVSTMMTFGLMSMVFKGLEYWGSKENKA
jgi:peptidoglycan/LPS O-acetylase OafA/YrhL